MSLEQLRAWFAGNDVSVAEDLVEIREGVRGFGIFSRCSLQPDQVVAVISKQACLSPRNSGIAGLLQRAMIDGHIAVTLAVMYERSIGEASRWHGYLQSLAENEPIVMLWSDEELRMLEGTELHLEVDNDRNMMRSDFEEIVEPFVRENRRELNARYFTFENFMNAFSLVSSRAFRVDRLHGEAMVPLADLFNHRTDLEDVHVVGEESVCPDCRTTRPCPHAASTDSDDDEEEEEEEEEEEDSDDMARDPDAMDTDISPVDMTPRSPKRRARGLSDPSKRAREESEDEGMAQGASNERTHLKITLIKPVDPGCEIFNTFGQHSNAGLIAKYGFAEEDNAYDVVNIDGSLLIDWAAERLSPSELKKRKAYMVNRPGVFGDLSYFGLLQSGQCSVELLFAIDYILSPVSAPSRKPSAGDHDQQLPPIPRSPAVHAAVVELAERRMALYPNSAAETKEMLAQPEINDKTRWALLLRKGEQNILQKCIELYSRK